MQTVDTLLVALSTDHLRAKGVQFEEAGGLAIFIFMPKLAF